MKEFYNCDCMEKMREYPDKYFDLAIVDPPYGLGIENMSFTKNRRTYGKGKARRRDYKIAEAWDVAPDDEYFAELFRISKNAIIWGGNYFSLPPTSCVIVWDKGRRGLDFADCEIAWASFQKPARIFTYLWNGMLQGGPKEERFHPTQKPVALYRWLLSNYANPGDRILDTHVGSASSLIACEELGFDYVGFEINKEYYKKAVERLNDFNAQMRMEWERRLP